MISTRFQDGQGLGNQLWAYVATRSIAQRLGYGFSIGQPENFKGREFMDVDFGVPSAPAPQNSYRERAEFLKGTTRVISRTDPKLFALPPNTVIEGNFQSVEYFRETVGSLREWLRVRPEIPQFDTADNVCVVHVRGGDYRGIVDVALPRSYYRAAMSQVRQVCPEVEFRSVTDDVDLSRRLLPDVPIAGSGLTGIEDQNKASHHKGGSVSVDFTTLKNSRYLIIPNSSFSWWAAFLNTRAAMIVAPKFWAHHNVSTGYWSSFDLIADAFVYLDRKGVVWQPRECKQERKEWEKRNFSKFAPYSTELNFPRKAIIRARQLGSKSFRGY